MQCPIDGATLTMSERSGIEIDYCPTCRGVWLDRGELDKILERASTQAAPAAAPVPQQAVAASAPAPRMTSSYQRGYAGHGSAGHRRKNWLSEIFD